MHLDFCIEKFLFDMILLRKLIMISFKKNTIGFILTSVYLDLCEFSSLTLNHCNEIFFLLFCNGMKDLYVRFKILDDKCKRILHESLTEYSFTFNVNDNV